MSRRPAVRLTPPRPISPSSLFVVLDHEIETHPLLFQSFPHSFAKTLGVSSISFLQLSTLHSSISSLTTLLESTLVDDLRVLTEINRNHPSASSLESTLTRFRAVSSLESALTKKTGEGDTLASSAAHSRISGRPAPFSHLLLASAFAYLPANSLISFTSDTSLISLLFRTFSSRPSPVVRYRSSNRPSRRKAIRRSAWPLASL
jgi:hypothetical protein